MTDEDKRYLDEKFTNIGAHLDEHAEKVDEKLADLKAYVDRRFESLKAYVDERFENLKTYVDERSEQVETKLLTAFRGWARTLEVRVRTGSVQVSGIDERLALAEERISDLERKGLLSFRRLLGTSQQPIKLPITHIM